MGRQPKKCPKKCTRHHFSLKPVHYSAFFSRESQFSYCPSNLKTQPSCPKFNRDGKPYTAAFILAVDQLKLIDNDQIYKIEHERFKKQNHEQKTQILIPKPRTKNCFCSVCKQLFQDYLEHTNCLKHKETIKSNVFNDEILNLCRTFGNHLHKSSRVIFPDELISSFASKTTNQTSFGCDNERQKNSPFQFDEPQLLIQKSTKQSLEGLNFYKSLKSFHSYGENLQAKGQNAIQNNFLQYSLIKQINDNYFLPHCGSFKAVQQTASPVKTRFQRPIILTGKSFALLDD